MITGTIGIDYPSNGWSKSWCSERGPVRSFPWQSVGSKGLSHPLPSHLVSACHGASWIEHLRLSARSFAEELCPRNRASSWVSAEGVEADGASAVFGWWFSGLIVFDLFPPSQAFGCSVPVPVPTCHWVLCVWSHECTLSLFHGC